MAMEKTYNKLVRDLIPDIIINNGNICTVSILDDDRYIAELKLKLVEESREVQNAEAREQIIEELADLLEVLDALTSALDIAPSEVGAVRAQKALQNGRFSSKLFLQTVIEK